MRAREVLFEMPYLTAGGISWGLDDPKRNRLRAGVILHTPHTVIRSDQFGQLYRRTRSGGGDFAHIASDTGLITYFMEYTTATRPKFGVCATQVKVWASIAPGMIGIAGDIFFNVMLVEFDTMVSDRIQTDDGRRFWLRRMAEAIAKGMRVGLIDRASVLEYSTHEPFQDWLTRMDGWGRQPQHHDRLFFISTTPIAVDS